MEDYVNKGELDDENSGFGNGVGYEYFVRLGATSHAAVHGALSFFEDVTDTYAGGEKE